MFVFLNNSFLPADDAKISVFDHGFLYADGIYETLRTVEGAVFDVQNHLQRLRDGARKLKLTIPLSDSEIMEATQDLVEKNNIFPDAEARIRWTLTRGINHFEFDKPSQPTFLITAVPMKAYPEEYVTEGISVTTIDVQRVLPSVKSTSLLPMILGKQKCKEGDFFECLFTENGFITEGTVSNFFVQAEDGFWTAPEQKVLPGTAAKIFMKRVEHLGMRVQEKLFSAEDVMQKASAAFLTNSLIGVLPVTKLEDKNIGDGKVSEVFGEVYKDFWNV